MLYKCAYDITKNINIFSFPILRKLRNYIYNKHLKTSNISVDSQVRVQKLHASRTASRFGSELHIGFGALVDTSGGVKIGDRVTISEGAKIFTHTHPIDGQHPDWRLNGVEFSELEIGDDAWIAANVIILASVNKIGKGAIIAAGSVVTKNVEDFAVFGGNPAKLLRMRVIGRQQ